MAICIRCVVQHTHTVAHAIVKSRPLKILRNGFPTFFASSSLSPPIWALNGNRWQRHEKLLIILSSESILRFDSSQFRSILFMCVDWFHLSDVSSLRRLHTTSYLFRFCCQTKSSCLVGVVKLSMHSIRFWQIDNRIFATCSRLCICVRSLSALDTFHSIYCNKQQTPFPYISLFLFLRSFGPNRNSELDLCRYYHTFYRVEEIKHHPDQQMPSRKREEENGLILLVSAPHPVIVRLYSCLYVSQPVYWLRELYSSHSEVDVWSSTRTEIGHRHSFFCSVYWRWNNRHTRTHTAIMKILANSLRRKVTLRRRISKWKFIKCSKSKN